MCPEYSSCSPDERQGRFETNLVASVCEISKTFATQDGQLAGLARLSTKIRMIPIGMKKTTPPDFINY